AVMLMRQGKWAEAEKHCRTAIKIDPKDANAHSNLGQALQGQGKWAESEKAYRDALAINPKHDWARPGLALAQRLAALEPKLAAVLKGVSSPRSAAVRLALAFGCQPKRLCRASAGLYADAFAPAAKVAAAPATPRRYNAACTAAFAGCGKGEDAAKLDEKE